MNYKVAFTALIAYTTSFSSLNSVSAFTLSSSNPAAKKVEIARANVLAENNEYLKMVAGGAQAGKEEYYEGELCYLSYTY